MRPKSTGVTVAASSTIAFTRADVLAQLRMDDISEDNALIENLTKAVIGDIEGTYDLALLEKTVVETFDGFPMGDDWIRLRIAPLISITSISYIDSTGTTQTWGSSQYSSGTYNGRGFVVSKVNYEYPTGLLVHPNAVTVTYKAGFGTAPESVPKEIHIGALMMIADLHANPTNPVRNLPQLSERFLQRYYSWGK